MTQEQSLRLKISRCSRKSYLLFYALGLVLSIASGVCAYWVESYQEGGGEGDLDSFYWGFYRISSLLLVLFAVVFLIKAVGRFHDFSRSGWWVAVCVVVSIVAHGFLSFLIERGLPFSFALMGEWMIIGLWVFMGLIPPTPYANKYGAYKGERVSVPVE